MSFLNPALALAGLALVAIPLAIHFLNRRRHKTVPWAAMAFLLAAVKKNRRRLKFESWLLLATRCAVVVLLAAALARPFGCGDSTLAAVAGRRAALHVIVLDDSYSMAYESNRDGAATDFDAAKELAADLLDRMGGGGDSVALVTASSPARAVVARPTYDLSAVRAAVERVPQSYGATDLPGALALAAKIAAEDGRQPDRRLHVITDDTAGAWRSPPETAFAEAAGPLASAFGRATVYDVSGGNGGEGETNAAVLDLAGGRGLVRAGFPASFTATVAGYAPSGDGAGQAAVRWALDGTPLEAAPPVALTAAGTKSERPSVRIDAGGRHVLTASLPGDKLPADDARRRVVDAAADLKVLIVETRRGFGPLAGSGAFLSLALAPPADATGAASSSYVAPERITEGELGSKALDDYRAVVLAGVGGITAPTADRLRRFVEGGGTLLIFTGEDVRDDVYNSTLLPAGLLPGPLVSRQSATGGAASAFAFDFRPEGNLHPYLQAFRGQQNSGLDTAETFTYWQVAPDPKRAVERVLNFRGAKSQISNPESQTSDPRSQMSDSADPAITSQSLGEGTVVFFAFSADTEWTTLPAKPAFVALAHEVLRNAVGGGDGWLNLTAGDALVVPPRVTYAAAPTLTPTEGVAAEGAGRPVPIELARVTRPDGSPAWQSPPIARPGLYTLAAPDGSSPVPVAVNVPAAESDTRPVDQSAVRQRLGPLGDRTDFVTAASRPRPTTPRRWRAARATSAGASC